MQLRLTPFLALLVLLLMLAGCGGGSSSKRSVNGSLVQISGVLQVEDLELGTIGAAGAPSNQSRSQGRIGNSYRSTMGVPGDLFSEHVPREWIVGVYPGVTLDDLKAWLAPFGVVPVREIYGTDAYVVEVPQPYPDPERLMESVLQKVPQLVYVEPNFPVRALGRLEPNDPRFAEQWNLKRVRLPEAWALLRDWPLTRPVTSSRPVRVAIMDTGICREHEDLNDDRLWDEASSFSMLPGLPPFTCGSTLDANHGTQVASVIAAVANNQRGMAGAFWDPAGHRQIQLIAARVLDDAGSGDVGHVTEAIRTLLHLPVRPDIINLSVGGPAPSTPLQEALREARQAGILVVAAAGNNGVVYYPAAYDEVVAVGSTDSRDARATGSGVGPALDLMAPGAGVLVATGRSDYRWASGTSFAAPLVSGIAALLMASGVEDAQEVRDLLLFTARSMPPYFNKASGQSQEYGWGLVDAAAALRLGVLPEVFIARESGTRLVRAGSIGRPAPNGAFSMRVEPREEELFLVGWLDVDRNRKVNDGDFFVKEPVRLAAGQAIHVGTMKALPYAGPDIPVD